VFAIGIIFCCLSCGGGGGGGSSSPAPAPAPDLCTGNKTTLSITNTNSQPITIGFVNAAVGGATSDISQLLTAQELANAGWCTDYQAGVDGAGKCLVTIGANATITVPNPSCKCISGGFGIGGFAQCETPEYPNGWTQGEFTLNPIATTQEAVDISAVNGVNYELSIALGSNWYVQTTLQTVTTVGPNRALNDNIGIPGVFPNNCTDCIQLVNNAPCPDIITNPLQCQASRICNIQRDNAPGGTVEFLIGPLL